MLLFPDHLRVLITRILEIQELFRIYTVKMLHIFLSDVPPFAALNFQGSNARRNLHRAAPPFASLSCLTFIQIHFYGGKT